MMIKPIGRVLITVKDSETFELLREGLERAFTHIAPTMVEIDPPTDRSAEPENIFTLIIKLYKPFWFSYEEEADSIWNEVLIPWLTNKLQLLQQNSTYFNINAPRHGSIPIHYDTLALKFSLTTFYFANPMQDDFTAVIPLLQSFRDKLNNGILKGFSIERVEFPWPGAKKEAITTSDKALERVLEDTPASDNSGHENALEDASLPESTPEIEQVSIDYSIWELVTSDGVMRLLDSSTDTWLE